MLRVISSNKKTTLSSCFFVSFTEYNIVLSFVPLLALSKKIRTWCSLSHCLAYLKYTQTFQCSIEALKTDRSASFTKHSAIACSIWKIPRPASASRALLRLTPCHQTYRRQQRVLVSGIPGSLELTGGEYKTWERIHHSMADLWLLANPASWSRVADFNPNLGYLWGLAQNYFVASCCNIHCITCVAQGIKGTCWPGVILAFLPRINK